jgi:hypothetical protein
VAFTRKAQYGETIPTAKAGEEVAVQLVEITSASGSNPQLRVEARIFVNNDSYTGPTKVALSFNDPEDIDALVAALETAATDARSKGMGKPAPKAKSTVAAEAVPVVPVARKGVAARKVAARRSAAK